jgi:hypothetical protein
MTHVIHANESAAVKDFTHLDVPDGDWLLQELKVGLNQASKVWESFLRESRKVLKQAFGKSIEEFSDINWLFEVLIQASGLRLVWWDDTDI